MALFSLWDTIYSILTYHITACTVQINTFLTREILSFVFASYFNLISWQSISIKFFGLKVWFLSMLSWTWTEWEKDAEETSIPPNTWVHDCPLYSTHVKTLTDLSDYFYLFNYYRGHFLSKTLYVKITLVHYCICSLPGRWIMVLSIILSLSVITFLTWCPALLPWPVALPFCLTLPW